MASSIYTIQTMTRLQLDMVIDWAASEGWNPGLHDASSFYTTDPTGFFIGLLDGQPIASISAVRYGTTYGFIGFYIVHPDYRGQGYGLKIWQTGLDYLKGRTIGLDGVVAQQANYIKSGFQLAHRNIRYEGIGGNFDCPNPQSNIVPLASLDADKIITYDRAFFPADRTQFLNSWLQYPDSVGVAVIDGNLITGYGLLRPCRTGYKIGPLFADTPQIAQDIFHSLIANIETGTPFYLDVPDINPHAVALAERHTMTGMFETARMYINSQPKLSLDHTYGITTFELG
ncbi:MAG: GNAT family N-acetyltransferase [Cyanobacteria bacterium J06597_1]